MEGQHGDSQLPVLLLDPEHQTPQSGDLPAIEEHLQQTQQADPPVETLEQRIDVGKDDADRRGFVLVIDEESQVGIREGHHALLHVPHLLIAQGNEAPVGGPGIIVDILDPGKLGIRILETKGADLNAFFSGYPSRQTIHPLGKPGIALNQEGDQVLLFGETARLGQSGVVWRIVSHHQRGRIIEALDEQPDLVIGGRVERPPDESHALLAGPRLHGGKEGRSRRRIVSAFKESPNAHLFAVELIIAPINDARDPAHRLRTTPGQKKLAFGRRPKRVPAGIQQPANFLL